MENILIPELYLLKLEYEDSSNNIQDTIFLLKLIKKYNLYTIDNCDHPKWKYK